MNEFYKHYCSEKSCKSRGNSKIATHQLSDYFWQCENCYQARKQELYNRSLNQRLLDWDSKQTVDSLDEALNYFSFLQKGRKFDGFEKLYTIHGYKGPICHVCNIFLGSNDPLGMPWPRNYTYFVCYNREYLQGYAAANFFERPPKHYSSQLWQSVHSKIVNAASEINHYVRIVIIMKSKQIHYVDPYVLRKWANEYECEHQLARESEPTCSIPITKLESYDPFFMSVSTLQESSKK